MSFEITKENIDQLRNLVEEQKSTEVATLMEDLHPADIAEIMDDLSIEEAKFIYLLPLQRILLYVTDGFQILWLILKWIPISILKKMPFF